jgi:hypothetical protein
MINAIRLSLAAAAVLILSGCEDQFRYPCMDKNNWTKDECVRPACAVTRTCPDHLLKPDELQGEVR